MILRRSGVGKLPIPDFLFTEMNQKFIEGRNESIDSLSFQIFTGMKLSMNITQPFVCYVSIYLGCDDILVAEEFLDGS